MRSRNACGELEGLALRCFNRIDRRFGTLLCLALIVATAAIAYWFRSRPDPHYRDSFASGGTSEWRAYGGSWDFYEGAIRNNSDERGAKLITGSSEWRDYTVEADLLLLGHNGDAGVVVR